MVTVRTMWWCSACQRRVEPQGRTAGGRGVHVTGMVEHFVSSAPYIEGELVPQREEAMAR
jgi:hypothetical protein